MRAPLPRTLAAALMAAGFAATIPSQAICVVARLIDNNFNYVYTGDVGCPGGYPCTTFNRTSVSPNFKGVFWSVGSGDPAANLGNDSGSFPARGDDGYGYHRTGWVANYPDYPPYIATTWAASTAIDGCPDLAEPAGTPGLCMAMLLTDQVDGQSYFALYTAESDALGNYDFAQPSGEMRLGTIDRPGTTFRVRAGGPILSASTRLSAAEAEVTVLKPQLEFGEINLDPACGDVDDIIVGYRVWRQILEVDELRPVDRDPRAGWEDVSGIVTDPEFTFVTHCMGQSGVAEDSDVVLATSLVFVDGFETSLVSGNSPIVMCGPNAADPIQLREKVRPGQPIELRRGQKRAGRRK